MTIISTSPASCCLTVSLVKGVCLRRKDHRNRRHHNTRSSVQNDTVKVPLGHVIFTLHCFPPPWRITVPLWSDMNRYPGNKTHGEEGKQMNIQYEPLSSLDIRSLWYYIVTFLLTQGAPPWRHWKWVRIWVKGALHHHSIELKLPLKHPFVVCFSEVPYRNDPRS